jgi:phospholipid transport system substrate-binding protein
MNITPALVKPVHAIMTVFVLAFIFTLSSFSHQAYANETSPYSTLSNVGNQLFKRIAALPETERKKPEVMHNIIEEELMPYIDYRYSAYKILGKYVKSTSKEQREKFVQVMRNYLAITYAKALTKYKDQQVIFEPEKPVDNQRIVAVHTEIVEQGAPAISIDFKLRKNKKTGQWKAFDMVVEGISLISSKQAEITRQIRELGVDAVITQLEKKVTLSV